MDQALLHMKIFPLIHMWHYDTEYESTLSVDSKAMKYIAYLNSLVDPKA